MHILCAMFVSQYFFLLRQPLNLLGRSKWSLDFFAACSVVLARKGRRKQTLRPSAHRLPARVLMVCLLCSLGACFSSDWKTSYPPCHTASWVAGSRRTADSAVQACKVTSSPGQSYRRPAALRAPSKAGGLFGCRMRCTGRNGSYSCLHACCTFLTCGGGECAVYPSRSSQAGEPAQLSSHRAADAGRR